MIAVAVAHTALLALYVLPDAWVPARGRSWSQAYVRPLWHQQWRLFAPDPPMTAAMVEVCVGDSNCRPIDAAFEGDPAMHRMALSIARYTEDALDHGRPVPQEMRCAMRNMVRDIGREAPELRFRLVLDRVEDPRDPARRVRTVIDLETDVP